jgi:hypothetical protein
MRRARRLAVPAAAAALLMAGCGDDEDSGGDQPAASTSTQTTTQAAPPSTAETEQPPAGEAPAGGSDAVKETIIKWTFEGDCELMTDKVLEEQAFVGDNRKERCKYFEDSFQKPQYSEDDVKFRKVTVNGTKATATIGSDISNVEADYKLVAVDGKWQIDEVGL